MERADLLTLTASEMTVLIGGLRVLNVTWGQLSLGVLTDQPQALTNDFFVNLLDMEVNWQQAANGQYEGRDRWTDEVDRNGS